MSYISVSPAVTPVSASISSGDFEALGGFPPGTTDSERKRIRKSWSYLWLAAYMAPRFQFYTGAAAASAVAIVFTIGLSSVFMWGSIAAATSLKDRLEEMVAWYFKRGKKVAKKYIQDYLFFDGTDKKMLQKALDEFAPIKAKGTSAIAISYFDRFIAPAYPSMKGFTRSQKLAFTSAFLNRMGEGKKEKECLAAGTAASTRVGSSQAAAPAAPASTSSKATGAQMFTGVSPGKRAPGTATGAEPDTLSFSAEPPPDIENEIPPGSAEDAEGFPVVPVLLGVGALAAVMWAFRKKQ